MSHNTIAATVVLTALALILAGLPVSDATWTGRSGPAESLPPPPAGAPDLEPNQALSNDLLGAFETSNATGHEQALEAGRIAMSHRQAQIDQDLLSADLTPPLERQQANLNLSRQILDVEEDPTLDRVEETLTVADRIVEDRQQFAEKSPMLPRAVRPGLEQTQAHLDTSRRLLDTLDAEHASDLEESVELAQKATRFQADAMNLTWETAPAGPRHSSPSEAARELVDRYGVEPTTEQEARLDRLDQVPEPAATELAEMLDAFLAFDASVDEAYEEANLTALVGPTTVGVAELPEREQLPSLSGETPIKLGSKAGLERESSTAFQQGSPAAALSQLREAGVDLSPVLPARNAFLGAVLDLDHALRTTSPTASYGAADVRLAPALAVDLSKENDTYTEDYAFVLDAGGNDTYPNNAGGSGLLDDHTGDCRLNPNAEEPTENQVPEPDPTAASLVDLGRGDDDYTSPMRGCGVRGGGYLGAGLLLDEGGTDTFSPRHDDAYLSQGAGVSTTDTSTVSPGSPSKESDPASPIGSEDNHSGASSNRFIVGLRDTPTRSSDDTFHGAPIVEASPSLNFLVVQPDDAGTFLDTAREDPGVRYVEQDAQMQLASTSSTPNDPRFEDQHGVKTVHAPEAWTTSQGDASTSLCFLDTGVDYTHPDLNGSRYRGGYDFVNDDSDPMDGHAHGTHVAGIATATINNSVGIAGTGNTAYHAVKAFDDDGNGYTSDIAQGIQWCADHGGDVISLAYEGLDTETGERAVENASAAGSLLVGAAGSRSSTCVGCISYPAAYEEVIAVTCLDRDTERCSGTNYGPKAELTAPGEQILSTNPLEYFDEKYHQASGTSMSTAFVAGTAALVWSQAEDLTEGHLRQLLRANAQDLGTSGCDEKFGYGIVNANSTLRAVLDGDRPTYKGPSVCMTGGHFASNGGGHHGAGLLVAAGEAPDTFRAGALGTNGGGATGLGGLVSQGGASLYVSGEQGTNGGGYDGSGFLIDTGSTDSDYRAESFGANGGAYSGGNGFLLDVNGADSYIARVQGTNGGGSSAASGFLFDAGGANIYTAGHGATNGGAVLTGSTGALLDAGTDTRYTARDRATNGGGWFEGVGLLVDATGNDAISATDWGTNGGGFARGAGALVDLAGDDIYEATGLATNGGAAGAAGFLLDTAGANSYTAASGATNGGGSGASTFYAGGVGSAGFLFDASSKNTSYRATHLATNGGGNFLGVGLLLDGGASNAYQATSQAVNGGAVTQGLGTLIDVGSGQTRYEAADDAANGGAQTPGAAGLLADGGGDDVYEAGGGATNGGGVDNGAGTLLDKAGNDTYSATDRGTNGGAFGGGKGLLVDEQGDDAYRAGACGANGGTDTSCLPPLAVANPNNHGLLLDGTGTDTYEDASTDCTDCTQAPKGGAGAQIDGDSALLWEAIQG